jgi:hypothetical protein
MVRSIRVVLAVAVLAPAGGAAISARDGAVRPAKIIFACDRGVTADAGVSYGEFSGSISCGFDGRRTVLSIQAPTSIASVVFIRINRSGSAQQLCDFNASGEQDHSVPWDWRCQYSLPRFPGATLSVE